MSSNSSHQPPSEHRVANEPQPPHAELEAGEDRAPSDAASGDEANGGAADGTGAGAAQDPLYRLQLDGREILLVGTAHVSMRSVELVREVIEREAPDTVCVELDPQRYQALAEKKKWESLDLKQIIRRKQLATLLVNLVLASYQKRLGQELGVEPGTELLEATKVAESKGIPVVLADRDVRVTLRRAARATPLWRRLYLLAYLIATLFERPEITEEQMQELQQQDVLNELMSELGRELPSLKKVLIDERDVYLATKILQAEGDRIVAVVGAGHLKGIRSALEEGQPGDLEALSHIPPASSWWKAIGWAIPLLILSAIGWIAYSKGTDEAEQNMLFWIQVNGIPAALGTLIALGHPLTILAAGLTAPLTSLSPLIGAGYVAAFVQAWVCPPQVKEFQRVADDLGKIKMWWKNRLLRVFLVFLLSTLGSAIGTWVGSIEIFSNLF